MAIYNTIQMNLRIFIVMTMCFVAISACTLSDKERVDKVNEEAYACHYRSLEATEKNAFLALSLATNYGAGKAEAYNNLAFVSIVRMDFPKAYKQLDQIESVTDNQVELLIADIQYMRLCQRQSKNKEFYDYRESAIRRMRRIKEEESTLTEHQRTRLIYARSEYQIVVSTYFYYVGLKDLSIDAMEVINPNGEMKRDTAQLLNYWYNMGTGSMFPKGTQEQVDQTEYEYLFRCYQVADQNDYPFWKAQALQAISEHLQLSETQQRLIRDNQASINHINIDHMPDTLLAGNLAQRAVSLFMKFGDVYQTAGAYRTLAECYWGIKDYHSALICLKDALTKNPKIYRAPDLVASLREQLCLVYSAINQKSNSDYNRNLYLDLQEQTRQDRQLEARAGQLNRSSDQLNLMIMAVLVMIIAVCVLLVVFDRMRKRNVQKNPIDALLEPLREWKYKNELTARLNKERYEVINEEIRLGKIHVQSNKKRNLEQRARVSLVTSITPFIDRMINEVYQLSVKDESERRRAERYEYIAELTDKINDYNDVLTQWIQMRQGELNLHIESFTLQSLFDIVQKGRMGFQLKGIELAVEPTTAVVKADKVLTLFMINTIADNARKFTPIGGTVRIYANEREDSVEICIEDNGQGMSDRQQANIFNHKSIIDEKGAADSLNAKGTDNQPSHGFGLMNCKGIIDKYHKISSIFSVCKISVDSKVGKGSCFSFCLPRGIIRFVLALIMIGCSMPMTSYARFGKKKVNVAENMRRSISDSYELKQAARYADSAYFCNINGTYARTFVFADSSLCYLNKYYIKQYPKGKDLMVPYCSKSTLPAELKWFRDSLYTRYDIILDIRNECAVAALALHKWDVYRYNNKVYTQLFRETSADNNLANYVRVMQRSENSKTVAIIILVLLLCTIFPAYYFLYYRHQLYYRFCVDRIYKINEILLSEDTPQDKLLKIDKTWNDKNLSETVKQPALVSIVKEIEKALKQEIQVQKIQDQHIESAEDELHRTDLENDNLYICNNVLDNCLSTLKHETMYYPSRIRQLVDSQGQDIQTLREVVEYYKDLYSVLSAQASRQLSLVSRQCQSVELPSICAYPLLGDRDMIEYLFDILKKQNKGKPFSISGKTKGDIYVVISVNMTELRLTDEQCNRLFTPLTVSIQFLLCRQIVRDIGEQTNARGCGMTATRSESGSTVIDVTLARARQRTNI